ncbi:hypothetical protein BDR04DRAFT_667907 [Suillus decipiens]|nr:hypothetical protein BDR04DRAFT_1039307 [Suillus decipiens]KAG2063045.1 hypothetical protein BDR04DRAFT_667907 [Suillus decipiens]
MQCTAIQQVGCPVNAPPLTQSYLINLPFSTRRTSSFSIDIPSTSHTIQGQISLQDLYIAVFAQARTSHVGLVIATSRASGCLVYIHIDRCVSPVWT